MSVDLLSTVKKKSGRSLETGHRERKISDKRREMKSHKEWVMKK
jgi:hypothetical protein